MTNTMRLRLKFHIYNKRTTNLFRELYIGDSLIRLCLQPVYC